jgi:asparaginyl-tRNA synthetase
MDTVTTFKFKPSYTSIASLHRSASEDIESVNGIDATVKGYIRYKRSQQKILFLQLYDGSHPVTFQLILDEDRTPLKTIIECSLNVGDCVTATGTIVKSPAKGQLIEMQVKEFSIIGKVSDPSTYLPGVKGVTLEILRDKLDIRSKFKAPQAIFRIRSKLSELVHRFFHAVGVLHLDPNVITTSDCEGAGEVFTITSLLKDGKRSSIPTVKTTDDIDYNEDFFLRQAYLTVSSQLQLEALCAGMGPVYTMNPSFRAEPSRTKRHLCCFTHLEWELPFIDLTQLMDFSEDVVTFCIKGVLTESMDDLKELDTYTTKGLIIYLQSLISGDFARISYDQAIEIIEKDAKLIKKKFSEETFDIPKWGDDLGSFCERYIAENICKKPVFVYGYPKDLKSFYMKQREPYEYIHPTGQIEVRYTVDSCDLLMPGLGELIGSSIREEDYTKLTSEMARRGMSFEPLQWYIDLRKDATFPHGGAGLGFDRLVALCTTGHIQDATPFPVSYKHCKF